MASVEDGIAAQIRNIEARYGRPLPEWFGLIAASGLTKHTEVVAMLKADYGMAHGAAHRVSLLSRQAAAPDAAVTSATASGPVTASPGEVADALKGRGFQYLVIDLNPHLIADLRKEGVPCIYGDAAREEVLRHASLEGEGRNSRRRVLRLGLRELPAVDDGDLGAGRPVGQRAAEGELHHLLRGLLLVAARLRAEGNATARPVGRTDGTLAGPASALLSQRLATTAAHLGPGQCALSAGAGSGQLGGDDLVHHRHVGLDAEERLVELDRAAD